MHPYVHCSTIYNSQDMEVPINRQLDKKNCATYIYNGILLGHEKNKLLPFATVWIDLEGIMFSEISQSEKDKYGMISLTCKT